MSDLYSKQKKILRVLLDNDFFEGIDFNKFLLSKFINQKALSPRVKTQIKEFLEEERPRYIQLKFSELKELIEKNNSNQIEGAFHKDFKIERKSYSDVAIMIKPIPDDDIRNQYTRGDMVYYLKGTTEYKSIRPEIAQRYYIYLKIKTDKEKAISKLKKAFKTFIKTEPKETSKDILFQLFIKQYNITK
ncbi:MAG: hypothetical protein IKQ24_08280 [Verrucomicrobia bacterium]|nr:hypothetical protein [Verrucomicrobiota bacterium]